MHADTVVGHAKEELLQAMYRSVERMNQSIVDGDQNQALVEQLLQVDLRAEFEKLDK